ncbi:ATP-binding protein [Streptomyces angustmyceticus]|uniref:ATP-binding protein n=1 Tax=Streptomyces angustmyceticus TaxID=285578 RepID=UPI00344DE857
MNATAPSEFTGSYAMPYRDADFHCPLPHIPEAVGLVRRRAHAILTGWNLPPDTVEDAVLVISEMVTNTVTHALPPALLQLSTTGVEAPRALHIEVTDAGPAAGTRRADDGGQAEEHGRGSGIVTALSVRHGIRAHRGWITRWADLRAA